MIEYADPEGKFLVARWDLGGSIKINEMDGSGEWRSSDFFNFVDRDGKAWQATNSLSSRCPLLVPKSTPRV